MDRPLIVNINMFTMAQSIYYPNGKIGYAYKDALKELIPEICYEENVYNVEIRGPISYTEKLIQEIKEEELTTYNKNKIQIKGVQN